MPEARARERNGISLSLPTLRPSLRDPVSFKDTAFLPVSFDITGLSGGAPVHNSREAVATGRPVPRLISRLMTHRPPEASTRVELQEKWGRLMLSSGSMTPSPAVSVSVRYSTSR